MPVSRDRASLIKSYKRQYYNHLRDLKMIVESELSGIRDEDFTPSTAIQTTFMRLVVASERLKALVEVEEAP